MVPTKRKRSTGAAVVATVVKWKVGDLVLTKMKSFPAWLAMAGVSHLGFGGSLGRLQGHEELDGASLREHEEFTMVKKYHKARCNLMFETIPKFARCNLMLQSYIERHTYSLHYIVYDKSQVKANQLPVANMIGYLEAKNHLLLGYCQDIVYYLLRKAKGLSVDGHPIACLLELLLQPSVSSLPYVD
ncbi:Sas10/Utp3/C1D family [Zea mays]|uniref:Sas10/Utp3/C1D family n=1 Tax=Zea mays TaxID=4577 RepID=A0A1D6FND4_MAIZE|nr:Sas10/Utp3/C1D family [Zea mays]